MGASSLPLFDCLHELPKYNRTNVHTPSNLSVNGALHHESFWSLHFHFHKRRKGGHCTRIKLLFFSGFCITSSPEEIAGLVLPFIIARAVSLFSRPLAFPPSPGAILCVSAWYKKLAVDGGSMVV